MRAVDTLVLSRLVAGHLEQEPDGARHIWEDAWEGIPVLGQVGLRDRGVQTTSNAWNSCSLSITGPIFGQSVTCRAHPSDSSRASLFLLLSRCEELASSAVGFLQDRLFWGEEAAPCGRFSLERVACLFSGKTKLLSPEYLCLLQRLTASHKQPCLDVRFVCFGASSC